MLVELDIDIDSINRIVVESLKDDFNNAYERKVQRAAKKMLQYYMTQEEFEEWISWQ